VLEVGAGIEDGPDLFGGQDLGKDPPLLLVGHALDVPVPVQALAIEEAECAGGLVEGGEADLALGGEVPLVGFDVLGGGLVHGPLEEPPEQPQHPDVGLLGPGAAVAGGESLGEERLERVLELHVFLLGACRESATWRKLWQPSHPLQADVVPPRSGFGSTTGCS